MIELIQKEHNLIGSSQAIKDLETKDHARLLVISDSHGHPQLLINIVKHFGPSCDALIFCGDGTMDLAELLEEADEDSALREKIPGVIAFVRGNGDPGKYPLSFEIDRCNPLTNGMLRGTMLVPDTQTLTVNGHNFFIAHGHAFGVDFGCERLGLTANLNGCKTAFYGHTHIAREEIDGDFKFINPGSCARPRGGQPSGCAIVTVEKTFTDTAFLRIIAPLSSNPEFIIYNPVM